MRRLPEVNARRLSNMKVQGVEEFADKVPDPLSKLKLGGRIDAPGLVPSGEETEGILNGMKTRVRTVETAAPVTSLDLTLTFRLEQDSSPSWERELERASADARRNTAAVHTDALSRWAKFWDRSHITIAPTSGLPPEKDKAWQAARTYQLIRHTMAANPSGRAMTLLNGGLFAADGNPDTPNWDGCQFMGQNQMLVYWPMLRAGDFDQLSVGCDFYRDRTAINRLKARKFWDVDGLVFNEPLSIFGLDSIGTNADGRSAPNHLHYHYTSGMVFALMILEHVAYTEKPTPGYADAAYGIISHYDHYYQKRLAKETGRPLDADGKIVIYPSDACEPYDGCTNNTDVLAGLHALTRDLLDTPPGVLTGAQRDYLNGFRKRIPSFTFEEKDGRRYYAAAAKKPEWIFSNGAAKRSRHLPTVWTQVPVNAATSTLVFPSAHRRMMRAPLASRWEDFGRAAMSSSFSRSEVESSTGEALFGMGGTTADIVPRPDCN